MASRYPSIKVVDYCYHPIRVVDGDKDVIVPCGKCDGCLLHKANQWSMRCGMEIEDTPATIFGSLTYNNKYYPKLKPIVGDCNLPTWLNASFIPNFNKVMWISDHSDNVRFNGHEDVLREDNIILNSSYDFPCQPIEISNWNNNLFPSIGYASKRDIQLWLKLLRRFLDEAISYKDKRVLERGYFRYFIISEYGPTTLRGHFHFLIFCQSVEISSALLESGLYQNWKMCSEDRFAPYVHLCDSGARGYVTQYLTCFSQLPKVYQQAKEIKPFRLASKAPAIGYIGTDKEKVYEDISKGTIKYSRSVPRLESKAILSYSSDYCVSLFPKCYRYAKLDDTRRFNVYAYLFRAVRKYGFSYTLLSSRLRDSLHSADYLAMCACYRFCKEVEPSPEYYYYLLDNYYYLHDMENLRSFYEAQEKVDFILERWRIFEFYSNIEVLCLSYSRLADLPKCLYFTLQHLGYEPSYLFKNYDFFESLHYQINETSSAYRKEVFDITENMVKMSKFNEKIGQAPTIV